MNLKNLWLILAAYGVWFAILSGIEEAIGGKYWKFILSLLFGVIVFWVVEQRKEKPK